jgi:hypothetical protein
LIDSLSLFSPFSSSSFAAADSVFLCLFLFIFEYLIPLLATTTIDTTKSKKKQKDPMYGPIKVKWINPSKWSDKSALTPNQMTGM